MDGYERVVEVRLSDEFFELMSDNWKVWSNAIEYLSTWEEERCTGMVRIMSGRDGELLASYRDATGNITCIITAAYCDESRKYTYSVFDRIGQQGDDLR